jgi:hypothetical protein
VVNNLPIQLQPCFPLGGLVSFIVRFDFPGRVSEGRGDVILCLRESRTDCCQFAIAKVVRSRLKFSMISLVNRQFGTVPQFVQGRSNVEKDKVH